MKQFGASYTVVALVNAEIAEVTVRRLNTSEYFGQPPAPPNKTLTARQGGFFLSRETLGSG
jgi:hypothetical protein